MNATPDSRAASPAADAQVSAPPPAARTAAAPALGLAGWLLLLLALLAAMLAVWWAWQTQARVHELETELVKRQQTSSDQAAEARLAAREAQDVARGAAAKLALLDERVAEFSLQRTQVEELMQVVARTRDQTVLSEIESTLRVAMQQSDITGSAQALLQALKQAEERLARQTQPRFESVRRAVGIDLERVKDAAVNDIPMLAARLDDVLRLVDELPLLVAPRPAERRTPPLPAAASAPADRPAEAPGWSDRWRRWGALVWTEMRSLVRVTSIEHPEAMLVTPEQAYFVRENLKLRLLNARLALLARQYDTVQSDLRDARASIERYFDRSAKPVQTSASLVRQVMAQTRQVSLPRPDATLAAIAAATSGR